MLPSEGAVPKRRNGKQQACEPCRKSKQRCDHTLPTCNRCKRRRGASECRYEPSPQTVASPKLSSSTPLSSSKKVTRSRIPLDLRPSDGYEILAAGSPYVQKCPNGYLGPTAYSAIFLEHQGKLDLGLLDPCRSYYKGTDDAGLCEHPHHVSVPHSVHCHAPNGAAIRLGMDILKEMPSRQVCERLIERYAVFEDIVSHKPTINVAHQSWWETYGDYLSVPRKSDKLSVVSEELCRNAWSLLETELPKNQREWAASCQGHNFRWELFGVLLAMFGLAAMSLPDWDPIFATQDEQRNDRRKFACNMRDLVEGCLLLCDHADNVSTLAVYLLHLSTTLQRCCETGKTSRPAIIASSYVVLKDVSRLFVMEKARKLSL